MESTALFEMALGLSGGWKVSRSEFAGEPRKLEIHLDFVSGQRFGCPECGELCPVHDTAEKRWRHLNFFQYRCELVARIPRVSCAKDGVRQVSVPWARPGSGFTLLMEAAVLLLAREMTVSAVAEILGEVDTKLWRLIVARDPGLPARRFAPPAAAGRQRAGRFARSTLTGGSVIHVVSLAARTRLQRVALKRPPEVSADPERGAITGLYQRRPRSASDLFTGLYLGPEP